MVTAFLYGLATALPLALGAAIGLHWTLPRTVLAGLMAFGAGTMIAAVSSELFEPAFEQAGAVTAGAALFAGAGIYVVANHLIENRLGPAAIGWALMLGTVLDGIPENTALGVSLTTGGGLVLVVAVAVGNVPEAVSGAALMRRQHGFSQTRGAHVVVGDRRNTRRGHRRGLCALRRDPPDRDQHSPSIRRWCNPRSPRRLFDARGLPRRRMVGGFVHRRRLPPRLRPQVILYAPRRWCSPAMQVAVGLPSGRRNQVARNAPRPLTVPATSRAVIPGPPRRVHQPFLPDGLDASIRTDCLFGWAW